MTICDHCTEHTAVWLLDAESPDGFGMTSVACRRDVDYTRALLARIGPPTITELDQEPEGR